MEIKMGMQWPETGRNGGELYWKATCTTDCSPSGGEGGGGGGQQEEEENK